MKNLRIHWYVVFVILIAGAGFLVFSLSTEGDDQSRNMVSGNRNLTNVTEDGTQLKNGETSFAPVSFSDSMSYTYSLSLSGVREGEREGKATKQTADGKGELTLGIFQFKTVRVSSRIIRAVSSPIEIAEKGYEDGKEVASATRIDDKIGGKETWFLASSKWEILSHYPQKGAQEFAAFLDSIFFQIEPLAEWTQTNIDAVGPYRASYKRQGSKISKEKSYLPEAGLAATFGMIFVEAEIENGKLTRIKYRFILDGKSEGIKVPGGNETKVPLKAVEEIELRLLKEDALEGTASSETESQLSFASGLNEKQRRDLLSGKKEEIQVPPRQQKKMTPQEVAGRFKAMVSRLPKDNRGNEGLWKNMGQELDENPSAIDEVIKLFEDDALSLKQKDAIMVAIYYAKSAEVHKKFVQYLRGLKARIAEGENPQKLEPIRRQGLYELQSPDSEYTNFLLEAAFDNTEDAEAKGYIFDSLSSNAYARLGENKDIKTGEFLINQALRFFETPQLFTKLPAEGFERDRAIEECRRGATVLVAWVDQGYHDLKADPQVIISVYRRMFDIIKIDGDELGTRSLSKRLRELLKGFEQEEAKKLAQEIDDILRK